MEDKDILQLYIEDNIAKKHKEPSMRAIHRLSDAIMLSRLSEGVTQFIVTEYGFAESLQIMTDDILKAQREMNTEEVKEAPVKENKNEVRIGL